MKYAVVYEKSETGWGAYAPDLPGLGVVGKTLEETKRTLLIIKYLNVAKETRELDKVLPF